LIMFILIWNIVKYMDPSSKSLIFLSALLDWSGLA
jgi:hypothetical protein